MIKTLIAAAVATAFSLGAAAADTKATGGSAPMAKSETMAAKPATAKPAKHTSTKTSTKPSATAQKHPKKPASAPAA